MARRRGQVQKRGTDKWLVRVFLGTVDGKRKYRAKTVRGTRADAELRVTQMLHEMDTPPRIDAPPRIDISPQTTVKEFLKKWLAGKEYEVEKTTLLDYRTRLKKDVYPYIGSVQLQQLTPLEIHELYTKLRRGKRRLSSRTVRYTHMILRQALEQAYRWELIRRNPADLVRLPKHTRTHHVQPLTRTEVTRLLEWSRERQEKYHALWTLLLTTGARPGELLALQWGSVDLEEGWISIKRAMTRISNGKWEPKEMPKTESSRRKVSLPETTARVLRDHRTQQLADHMKVGIRSEYVFCNHAGNPFDISRVRKAWKKACRTAEGVPEVRLYDARHTHATHLLENGVNPKLVAERLGHSSIRLTLDTYSHVIPSMQRETAEQIEAALFG